MCHRFARPPPRCWRRKQQHSEAPCRHDFLSFLLAWMAAAPRRVGTIAPSSAALGELITRDDQPQTAPVLELGPGTGVLDLRIAQARPAPAGPSHWSNTAPISSAVADAFSGRRRAVRRTHRGSIASRPSTTTSLALSISGLPLLNMSSAQGDGDPGRRLRPAAPGCAFTVHYGPTCPLPRAVLERLGLRARRVIACCGTCRLRPCTASRGVHR